MIGIKLNEIIIDEELLDKVKSFNIPDGWNSSEKCIKEFKSQMKIKLFDNQSGRCAYCGLPLATRSPEIDHIAPKGGQKMPMHYEVTFLPLNLVYACHYCNSTSCKGKRDVVESKTGGDYKNWHFKIVHPYLDDPRDYFESSDEYTIIIRPKKNADAYHVKKAKETIEMFNLDTEGYLNEKAKQILFEKNPEAINKIITEISTYRIQ